MISKKNSKDFFKVVLIKEPKEKYETSTLNSIISVYI